MTDPTGLLSTLNVLMELYLEDSAYSAGVKLIERWKNHVARLPLDLTGKYAICLIYLDRPVEAQRHVDDLRAHDATTYADLYFEVAEAYNSCGRQMEALELYQQVLAATGSLSICRSDRPESRLNSTCPKCGTRSEHATRR